MARTDSMPEARGINKFIRPLRYHEASRQWFAVFFVLLVSLLGQPVTESLYAGGTVAVLGAMVRLWASGHVMKNEQLATDGPYAWVRHPLYVGNILIVFGFSIASMLWWSYLLMIFLLWFYYPPAISYEDAKLQRTFGDDWVEWSRRTRALIPTLPQKGGASQSSWSFSKSLFRNLEPIIVLYLAGCFYLLYANLPG